MFSVRIADILKIISNSISENLLIMKSQNKRVILTILGSQLDSGLTNKRWERWRPTVALADKNFGADRIEILLTNEAHQGIADTVVKDIHSLGTGVDVVLNSVPMNNPWDFEEVYSRLYDFAKNYDFKDGEEYIVHLVTGTHVSQICLFLLTESKIIPAKLMGSYAVNKKELGVEPWKANFNIIDLELSNYDSIASRFKLEQVEGEDLLKGGICTLNPSFNALIGKIETVSIRSIEPILLMGPTGAGKTALASRIYELRRRKHMIKGAFIEVNCATLRGENAMSALFGHKKGAFTGATSDREGFLKAADGGLLMLDEIGTLGLDEQAMLLRALEDKRFIPFGSDKPEVSDFQLIAGTNLDLYEEVRAGRFRADLLARIDLWSFELPGLSARTEDIEPNLDYEIALASDKLGVQISMNKDARKRFMAFSLGYPWPGNFRDLHASVLRMATLCSGGRITIEDVESEIKVLLRKTSCQKETAGEYEVDDVVQTLIGKRQLDSFERVQLEHVIRVVKQSASLAEAGRSLFKFSLMEKSSSNDSHRLKKYLERYALTFDMIKSA